MTNFRAISAFLNKLFCLRRCRNSRSCSSSAIPASQTRTDSSNIMETKLFRRNSSIVAEPRYEFDVFLSFRGEDMRHGFTKRLYGALVDKSIRTFFDNEDLERGDKISTKLQKSIEGSEIFVPIFSERYAESRWCLMELAQIVECGRLIVPVFVQVDPFNVQTQNGPYGIELPNFEKRFGVETVNKWREALKVAGKALGFTLVDDRKENDVIKKIIKRVMENLKNPPLNIPEQPIGIEPHVEYMMSLLDVNDKDVRMVAIHGKKGIGKTTLAKAIYNKIFFKFDAFLFFPVVESASGDGNLVELQKGLVRQLLKAENPSIGDVNEGISVIKETVRHGTVLIILDDVDDERQLDVLVGKHAWFRPGSRIIITTDNEAVLNANRHQKYPLEKLDDAQSLQLLSRHAFSGKTQPPEEFYKLSTEAVSLCEGLPGKLVNLGEFLSDKTDAEEWEDALKKKRRDNPL